MNGDYLPGFKATGCHWLPFSAFISRVKARILLREADERLMYSTPILHAAFHAHEAWQQPELNQGTVVFEGKKGQE